MHRLTTAKVERPRFCLAPLRAVVAVLAVSVSLVALGPASGPGVAFAHASDADGDPDGDGNIDTDAPPPPGGGAAADTTPTAVCPKADNSLKSAPEAHAMRQLITLHNTAGISIAVSWVGEDGTETELTRLPHGMRLNLQTWVGSVLRARAPDHGHRLLSELVVSKRPKPWTVKGCHVPLLKDPFTFAFEQANGVHFEATTGAFGGVHNPLLPGEATVFDIHMTLGSTCTANHINVSYQRDVVCSHCHGMAAEQQHLHVCPRCNGTGMVTRLHNLGVNLSEAPVSQQIVTTCPVCDGYGSLPDPEHLCPVCHGERIVKTAAQEPVVIPAGVRQGFQVTMPRLGNEHPFKHTGDVVLTVVVAEDELAVRDEYDLLMELNVTLAEALAGFNHTVTHPGGHEVRVLRRGMTVPGHNVTVTGEGVPILDPCYMDSGGYNYTTGECYDVASGTRHDGDSDAREGGSGGGFEDHDTVDAEDDDEQGDFDRLCDEGILGKLFCRQEQRRRRAGWRGAVGEDEDIDGDDAGLGNGDLKVTVNVQFPTAVSTKTKKKLSKVLTRDGEVDVDADLYDPDDVDIGAAFEEAVFPRRDTEVDLDRDGVVGDEDSSVREGGGTGGGVGHPGASVVDTEGEQVLAKDGPDVVLPPPARRPSPLSQGGVADANGELRDKEPGTAVPEAGVTPRQHSRGPAVRILPDVRLEWPPPQQARTGDSEPPGGAASSASDGARDEPPVVVIP